MSVIAAVVFVAAVVALANRTGDGTIDDLAVSAPSTLETTTSAVPPTALVEPPPSTEVITDVTVEPPPPAPDRTDPPTTDTTAPPAPTIQLRLTEASAPDVYPLSEAPRLIWSVTGAASVRVEGFAGGEHRLLSEAPEGETRLCPGTTSGTPPSSCTAGPGPYDYLLRAFDAAGNELARQTVTLTIGPP